MAKEVREPELTHVTITGRVVPLNNESYMELVLLAYRFRKSLTKAIKMYAKGVSRNTIVKEITKELNLGYADTIYKLAKLIVEGVKHNGSNPLKIRVRKLFIASRGFSSNKGNRNIRLLSTNELQVNIPWRGWIKYKAVFGGRYIPLVKELVKRALSKELSYTVKITFRDDKVYLHVSVPMGLYLKYFSKGKADGNLIAGFDLNSDRVNMVIVDRYGIIRDVKTEWFPEVTSHGFLRNKACTLRFQALAKLLKYAYYHGVGVVLFEDLSRIKKRRYTKKQDS
ncbi:MAG: transposase [Thermoprotei archaeon]|nr:MAG: transposase [Thermoprotei archaeon]